ncbi:MAG TPA: M20/M25/M40 family metallo-hydrolase, partial [Candidatus Acidoferrales bacterium]|nr:M20/M25/M40 family metallo-hydrolase [Candidatus Acidoferrales bacterium]
MTDPLEIAQRLIRFDTTNPPGNERECVEYVRGLLQGAGLASELYGGTPERPNLVARLKGRGQAPPLLLQGHVDVVTTDGQAWTRPPFEAVVEDGWLWGRGTLDMKGGVAMMVSAFLRAAAEGGAPGDLVLAVLADEEAGGLHGASWLVDHRPDLFSGIRHALGEAGAVAIHLGGRRFYPIMLTEKRGCQMRVTLRGPGGHGSLPMRGGAMARLGELLTRLDRSRLPYHLTPATRLMLEGIREALQPPLRDGVAILLDPARADGALDELGALGRELDPLLHNTVNATVVRGGSKINVVPAEVSADLDGRLLPGYGPDDMVGELRQVIGDQPQVDVVLAGPAQPELDLSLYDQLAAVLREADPEGV